MDRHTYTQASAKDWQGREPSSLAPAVTALSCNSPPGVPSALQELYLTPTFARLFSLLPAASAYLSWEHLSDKPCAHESSFRILLESAFDRTWPKGEMPTVTKSLSMKLPCDLVPKTTITVEGLSSIPGQGTRNPHLSGQLSPWMLQLDKTHVLKIQCSQKKNLTYNSIKKNKTLWVNLTQKKCKTGNYKILLKESKDPNKWKDLCVHELEDLVLLRWQ